jgi:hypothetical protein
MAVSSSAAPVFAGLSVVHITFAWQSDEPAIVEKAMGIMSEWSLGKRKCCAHRDSLVWSATGFQFRMKSVSTYMAAYAFIIRMLGHLVPAWGQGSCWRVMAVTDVTEVPLPSAASPSEASVPESPEPLCGLAPTDLEQSWCPSPTFKLIRGGPVLADSRSHYTFGEKLGEGVYGEVYEGFRSGRPLAVKFIKACDTARTDAAAEAYVLDRCRGHPHIVQLVDVFRGTRPNGTAPEFALVFEHAGVSLSSCIRRKKLSYQTVRLAMADIVDGVGYLHGLGLVHGDLKPCNVLVRAVGGFEAGESDSWQVKVGDVGLAVLVPQEQCPDATHSQGRLWLP